MTCSPSSQIAIAGIEFNDWATEYGPLILASVWQTGNCIDVCDQVGTGP